MKVLVFDDSAIHRQAALLTLGEHDLTVVGTYDEAAKLLSAVLDYDEADRLFKERYSGSPYDRDGISDQERETRFAFYKECREKATRRPDFDVVLTDLLVPASSKAQGPEGMRFVGEEMPLGTAIALRALSVGVKMVAVVTDMNHHNHPASAAFDGFGPAKKIGDIVMLCTNNVGRIYIDTTTGKAVDSEFLRSEEGRKAYPQVDPKGYSDERVNIEVGGKDWGKILKQLLQAQ